jgi:hypothetical protein
VISACDAELSSNGPSHHEARLLRATFYILTKQQDAAFSDLAAVIDDEEADPKIRVNALIKRASLYIQRCKDPVKDPQMSFADFDLAIKIDPDNTDIYHHRGQVICRRRYSRYICKGECLLSRDCAVESYPPICQTVCRRNDGSVIVRLRGRILPSDLSNCLSEERW